MITLHHLNNSRSQRILWLLEELNLPYEITRYARDPVTMLAPPALKAVHPLGKSPVITDGDQVFAESGAIVEYLLDRYADGKLRPATGTRERQRFTFWLHFAEGSAMPPLLLSLVFRKIRTSPAPFFVKPILKAVSEKVMSSFVSPNLKANFAYIEDQLTQHAYLAGNDFTAADIQMSFPIEAGAVRGDLLGPATKRYLERLHERPAYLRARERGGDFEVLS
jgi:glutathione S-transferase